MKITNLILGNPNIPKTKGLSGSSILLEPNDIIEQCILQNIHLCNHTPILIKRCYLEDCEITNLELEKKPNSEMPLVLNSKLRNIVIKGVTLEDNFIATATKTIKRLDAGN